MPRSFSLCRGPEVTPRSAFLMIMLITPIRQRHFAAAIRAAATRRLLPILAPTILLMLFHAAFAIFFAA